MATRIPASVVTGFLGAGKTSLIRHVVEQANGRRLAFLINEFGDLGVDREILLGCGLADCREDDIVELPNGCICCTVADDFLPTMERLLARDPAPDHIVIETSGLALPKPLVQAFAWPEVRSRATVDGVLTVVDAAAAAAGRFAADPAAVARQRAADPALDHDSPLEELFADQLACADLVVLNKADLLDNAALEALRTRIAGAVRPGVRVLTARHGRVEPRVLLGLAAAAEDDLAARPSHHDGEDDHDHDEFDSLSVTLGPVADPAALERRLQRAITEHGILRVKGFLDRPGRERREVLQAVGPRIERYFDRAWRPGEARTSTLVVIGLAGMDRAAIAAALHA